MSTDSYNNNSGLRQGISGQVANRDTAHRDKQTFTPTGNLESPGVQVHVFGLRGEAWENLCRHGENMQTNTWTRKLLAVRRPGLPLHHTALPLMVDLMWLSTVSSGSGERLHNVMLTLKKLLNYLLCLESKMGFPQTGYPLTLITIVMIRMAPAILNTNTQLICMREVSVPIAT